MIDYIRGILTIKEVGRVTVEVNGIGYEISIPLSTYELLPAPGTETVLQIHYHVREDGHKLFGFHSREEREIFRQLIGISKIGPKVALNVLSGVSLQDLMQSVNKGDPTRLQRIPGVGGKTAQRLVMELRGKLGLTSTASAFKTTSSASDSGGVSSAPLPVRDEVYEAMLSLGYNEKQVSRALERVEPGMKDDEPVEAWIRKVLQVI